MAIFHSPASKDALSLVDDNSGGPVWRILLPDGVSNVWKILLAAFHSS
jgi:hypothetical protein